MENVNFKSKLAKVKEDTLALSDSSEATPDFDIDQTVYDLKTFPVKKGKLVIVLESCEKTNQALVLINEELYWICHSSLDIMI